MPNYKNPLQLAEAIQRPEKPVLNNEFYSNAYKDGYRLKGNEARLGKGRINYLISEYGVWDDDSDYAQAYLGFIDPRDFIKGTTYKDGLIRKELENQPELDINRVNNEIQTPFLSVDFDGQVIKGHEGRHRLASFAKSGINRVPVVFRDYSPNFSKNHAKARKYNGGLAGQRFGPNADEKAEAIALNSDLIPLNYKNILDLYRIFSEEE